MESIHNQQKRNSGLPKIDHDYEVYIWFKFKQLGL
jgi:hypothetical protein